MKVYVVTTWSGELEAVAATRELAEAVIEAQHRRQWIAETYRPENATSYRFVEREGRPMVEYVFAAEPPGRLSFEAWRAETYVGWQEQVSEHDVLDTPE